MGALTDYCYYMIVIKFCAMTVCKKSQKYLDHLARPLSLWLGSQALRLFTTVHQAFGSVTKPVAPLTPYSGHCLLSKFPICIHERKQDFLIPRYKFYNELVELICYHTFFEETNQAEQLITGQHCDSKSQAQLIGNNNHHNHHCQQSIIYL